MLREEALTEEEHTGVVAALDHRWPAYERPLITENLIRLASDFAQRYALGGYDSIQLASAFVCNGRQRNLRFLSFDDLNEAAKQIVSVYEASS